VPSPRRELDAEIRLTLEQVVVLPDEWVVELIRVDHVALAAELHDRSSVSRMLTLAASAVARHAWPQGTVPRAVSRARSLDPVAALEDDVETAQLLSCLDGLVSSGLS
jgi:hypothetical protein